MVHVTVLGLARDCAGAARDNIRALAELGSRVDLTCYIGENGSRDETPQLLEQAQTSGLLHYVETTREMAGSSRLERMARGREALRRHIPEQADLVVVVDFDERFVE